MDFQENAKKLPDELIQQVSGGTSNLPSPTSCPRCGSNNIVITQQWHEDGYSYRYYRCNDCDYRWPWKSPDV